MVFFPALLLVMGPEGDFGSWEFVWACIKTSRVALYLAGHPLTNALGDALERLAAGARAVRKCIFPARRGRNLDIESLDDQCHVDGFGGEEPLETHLPAHRPPNSPTSKAAPERPARSALKKKHTMFEDGP